MKWLPLMQISTSTTTSKFRTVAMFVIITYNEIVHTEFSGTFMTSAIYQLSRTNWNLNTEFLQPIFC
jgi:hypothetical protein